MNTGSWRLLGASAVLALGLISCQTTKPAAAPLSLADPAASSIVAQARGFSPEAQAGAQKIDFDLKLGNPEAIKGWKVELAADKGVQKTFSGTGSNLPSSLSWDGKGESGALAPEGKYTALLSLDYSSTYKSAKASSASFVLDITPPSGRLVVSPQDVVPNGQGFNSPVSIVLDAASPLAGIASWSLDIVDPAGRVFKSYAEKWPDREVKWDGLSAAGAPAVALASYKAIARVRDEFGNMGSLDGLIPVGDLASVSGATFIEAPYSGFAPRGESMIKTMDLTLGIAQKEALKSWRIELVQADGSIAKSLSGDSRDIPSAYSWDGTDDHGLMSPESQYTARLSVDYGTAFKPVTESSRAFLLDLTPPTGRIESNPAALVPDGKGGIQPMKFTIEAISKAAPLQSWSLSLIASDGNPVLAALGSFPDASYSWDGKLSGASALDPTKTFALGAKIVDVYGNAGTLSEALAVSALPSPASSAMGLPAKSTEVSITPKAVGFAPKGDGATRTMEFELDYGQAEAVQSWKVEIVKEGRVEQVITGDMQNPPSSIAWDGKRSDGSFADEGSLTARLSVDYGSAFAPASATSAPFVLDLTAPQGAIRLSEALFSPLETDKTIGITVDASSSLAKMDRWTMQIYDPAGNLFKSFRGNWPDNKVEWDGRGFTGDMVDSAEDYPVVATVRDEFGNLSELKSTIPVDILVEKTAAGYRILSSRIFFKPYTADYNGVSPELAKQNRMRLDQLAAKLKKFPDYKVKMIGHAVMINWDDPARGRAEQQDVLLPLSSWRAEAIKEALVARGISGAMIDTQGVGASDQLVPDSDLANRWRNRRVALYLENPMAVTQR